MSFAVVIVERDVKRAHPSFVAGGYIVLNLTAAAFRNADMVPAHPGEMLAWCRANGCVVSSPTAADDLTRRYRVDFPDETVLDAFRQRFPGRGAGTSRM